MDGQADNYSKQIFLGAVLPVAAFGILILSLVGLLVVLHDQARESFYMASDIVAAGIAFSAFALTWFARRFGFDGFVLLAGTASLAIGILEILPVLSQLDPTAALARDRGAMVLASDALLAGTLLVVVVAWRSRQAMVATIAAQTLFLAAMTAGYLLGLFGPALPIDVFAGLSLAVVMLHLGVLALLLRRDGPFDRAVQWWLFATIGFNVAALVLRLWTPAPLLVEHMVELMVQICLFLALVVAAVARPQAGIAAALERERALSSQLAQDAQVLEAILNATPDFVYLRDPEGRYSYVNPAGAEAHGIPRALWKGRHWSEIGLAPSLLAAVEVHFARVMRGGEAVTAEGTLRGRRYEYRLTPLLDSQGRVQRVLSVARDVTEQASARGALQESVQEAEKARRAIEQASDARTRFLAAASHDLRQPLQAIRLYLDLLGLRLENGEHSDLVRRARESLDSGEVLLKSLLDLSTLLAGIVKPRVDDFPVVQILEKLATEGEEIAFRKGIELRVVASSANVRSDPVLLQRILRNLLVNAIRYTGSGGKVLIGCRRRGAELRIDVIDTGIGIPADQQDLIFEEFYQLGPGRSDGSAGLGLGLSIVRRTARLLGHRVAVASVPDKGSCFSVMVPVVEDGAPHIADAAAVPSTRAAGRNALILVIEDDTLQLAAIAEFVSAWGHRPILAETGDQAVELVRDGCRPDAIITDYRLPGTLSGIEAVGRIRAMLQRPLPAILATGDTAPERLRAADSAEMAILHKPYHAEALHEMLDRVLTDAPVS